MTAPTLRPAALLAVLGLALLARCVPALWSPNLFWPDEVYQTIEPAHRIVFGDGIRSFEWLIGLRSWVLPGLLAGVMKLTAPLGAGSSGYLGGIAVTLALLSLWPIAAAARLGGARGGASGALLAAALLAVWFDLVYFAPKALTEVVAAHLLLPAIAIGATAAPGARRPLAAATLLLGLAVAFRPHVAPGAAVAWLWLVARAPRATWKLALACAVAPTLAFGLVDWFTHGRPFGSLIVNFTFNVGDSRSLEFGWLPKYYYAVYLWRTWTPPVAVAFALLWCLGLRRAPLPALCALAIVGSHSLLGHKEYRFVFPALPLLLVGVAAGAQSLVERARTARRGLWTGAFVAAFATASLYAGLDFHRAKTPTGLGDRRTAVPYWRAFRGELLAMRDLSLRDDVRGVAVAGIEWQYCGGYSWLHHDVPLFFVDHPDTPAPAWPHVDHVVARGPVELPPGFVEVAVYDGVRVLRRDGPVTPLPGYDVEQVLRGR